MEEIEEEKTEGAGKGKKKWGIRDFKVRKAVATSFYRSRNTFRSKYFVLLAMEKESSVEFEVGFVPYQCFFNCFDNCINLAILILLEKSGSRMIFHRTYCAIAPKLGAKRCAEKTFATSISPFQWPKQRYVICLAMLFYETITTMAGVMEAGILEWRAPRYDLAGACCPF